MKICMFTNTFLPHVGGVARSVSTFAEDLRHLGHQVLIVAPTFPDHRGESPEEGVVRVPAIQNFNGSDFSVQLPLPYLIDARVKEFKPDVIHSHHPFLLGDSALRTAHGYRLPLIFTHHTLYEQYTHYVPFDSETIKRFVIHLATGYANLCDAVIAPSLSVLRLLRERRVTRPIVEIPTGIDTAFFGAGDGAAFRKKFNIGADVLVIGHLGRLAKEKNLPYLAEAVALFMRQWPKACFLVSGKGDAEGEIRRILARNGQEEKLILTGVLAGADLADAYRAMDLFVFASQSETQGLVLTEAMAAATPVIALDASGAREVVRNGVNGILLPADAGVRQFAEAIATVAGTSQEDPRQMRESALATAARFSRQRCVMRLLDLYEQTCGDFTTDALPDKEETGLETIFRRLETEWDLLSEKIDAIDATLSEER